MKRLTQIDISIFLQENGCKYLSGDYINSDSVLHYIAQCGHEKYNTWHDIKSLRLFKNCKKCAYNNRDNRNITIEDVVSLFTENKCEVFTTQVNNIYDSIKYRAQCGHIRTIKYSSFKYQNSGRLCLSCARRLHHPSNQPYSQKEMEIRFEERGCKLISQYKHSLVKVKYLAKCGHENTILPSAFSQGQGTYCPLCVNYKFSEVANKWLNLIASHNQIKIHTIQEGKEFVIPNTSIRVDGFCQDNNTIYEFYGDYWHGNPRRYNPNDINPSLGISFGELYRRTIEREQKIKDLGYNLITIWEMDWNQDFNN